MTKPQALRIKELEWEIMMLKIELKTRKRLHKQRIDQYWELIPEKEKTSVAVAKRAFRLLLMNRANAG